MTNTELEKLLEDDPLTKAMTETNEAIRDIENKCSAGFEAFKAMQESIMANYANITDLDLDKKKELLDAAEILGTSIDNLAKYHMIDKKICAEVREKVTIPLIEEGKKLIGESPVVKIVDGTLPAEEEKPYLVLYTAQWCGPCRIMKPTFARLAHYFDKGKLFYTEDGLNIGASNPEFTKLSKKERVVGYPSLVSYVGQAKLHHAGASDTKHLWEAMNQLVIMAEPYAKKDYLGCLVWRGEGLKLMDGPLTREKIMGK